MTNDCTSYPCVFRCAQTEEDLLEAFESVKKTGIANGGIAYVAKVAEAKRVQDPVIWTATVAQAFGQLLQVLKTL